MHSNRFRSTALRVSLRNQAVAVVKKATAEPNGSRPASVFIPGTFYRFRLTTSIGITRKNPQRVVITVTTRWGFLFENNTRTPISL